VQLGDSVDTYVTKTSDYESFKVQILRVTDVSLENVGGLRAEWKAIRDSNFWLIFVSACQQDREQKGTPFTIVHCKRDLVAVTSKTAVDKTNSHHPDWTAREGSHNWEETLRSESSRYG
jgi:hypothetical protein